MVGVGPISEYADQLANDPKLRKRVVQGIRASVIVGAWVRRQTGPFGLARGLASDPVLLRQAGEVVLRIGQAKPRIDRRRHRRSRVAVTVVALASVAIAAQALSGMAGRRSNDTKVDAT